MIDDLQETEEPTISLPVWADPVLSLVFLRIEFPCFSASLDQTLTFSGVEIKLIWSEKLSNHFPPNVVEHHQKHFLAASKNPAIVFQRRPLIVQSN